MIVLAWAQQENSAGRALPLERENKKTGLTPDMEYAKILALQDCVKINWMVCKKELGDGQFFVFQ